MKCLILLATLVPILSSAQTKEAPSPAEPKIHWIWKGDPFFYRYPDAKDFGLYVENGELKYKRLMSYGHTMSNMPLEDKYLHPIRLVDEGWIDLSKKYKVLELSRFYSKKIKGYHNDKWKDILPEWHLRTFTIDKVLAKDSGVVAYIGTKLYGDKLVFIQTHRNVAKLVADSETVRWMVKEDGTAEYTPSFGETQTLRKYYYGYAPIGKSANAEALRWVEKEYESEILNLKEPNE